MRKIATNKKTLFVMFFLVSFAWLVSFPNFCHAKGRQDLRAGYASMRLGDMDSALYYLNRAIKSKKLYHTELLTALSLRGEVLRKKRILNKALQDFNFAISLAKELKGPDELANLYTLRGRTYRSKGDYKKAIADYNQALTLRPNYAEAYFYRGNAYRLHKHRKKALADFNRAINLNPTHHYYYYRSGVLSHMGKIKEAIRDIKMAIKLKPNRAAYKSRLNYLETHFSN